MGGKQGDRSRLRMYLDEKFIPVDEQRTSNNTSWQRIVSAIALYYEFCLVDRLGVRLLSILTGSSQSSFGATLVLHDKPPSSPVHVVTGSKQLHGDYYFGAA
ncbi:unnamed protein product, partial [Aphanomyces euteiches]